MIKSRVKFAAAAAVYLGFAAYLYWPYARYFTRWQYLLLFNGPFAATAVFLLSSRWVYGFWGRLLAGALYGFGPFVLGLGRYHPTAGFLAGAAAWLFLPAAQAIKLRRRWLQAPLCILAFIIIALVFEALAYLRFFPLPLHVRLDAAELVGLAAPLAAAQAGADTIGLYHIPLAALAIGVGLLFVGRRFGILGLFVAAVALTFCPPVLNVSPFIWPTVAMLVCSVVAGAGLNTLLSAGCADRKWLLSAALVLAALALLMTLAAKGRLGPHLLDGPNQATIFMQTAKLYLVGSTAVTIIYFLAAAGLRMYSLRLTILGSAMAVDIFFGAGFIVDRMF